MIWEGTIAITDARMADMNIEGEARLTPFRCFVDEIAAWYILGDMEVGIVLRGGDTYEVVGDVQQLESMLSALSNVLDGN